MAEFYLVICLYVFQSQTSRINELTSDISWVCRYTNMWFKFVDVCDGWVIDCSIKKPFLPCIYTKLFYLKWSNLLLIDFNSYDITCNYNTQHQ